MTRSADGSRTRLRPVLATAIASALVAGSFVAATASTGSTGAGPAPTCADVDSAGTITNGDGTTSVVVLGSTSATSALLSAPAGVTSVTFDVCGAQGEDAQAAGGAGGRAVVTVATPSGVERQFRVVVGTRDGSVGQGGASSLQGGNGGGYSAVTALGGATTALLAVAGGGGGGGAVVGGVGGGTPSSSTTSGKPGDLCNGGAGGSGASPGQGGRASAGGLSNGGSGGVGPVPGAGGGGGLRGGGGGAGASSGSAGGSGGGGSSFARKPGPVQADLSVTSAQRSSLGRSGQGAVVMTYRLPAPPATVSVVRTADGAEEGPTSAQFEVRLSRPSDVDTVVAYTRSGTASHTSDYADPAAGQVTVPSGSAKAALSFPVVDDQLEEPQETLTLTLTASSNADVVLADSGAGREATASLTDDDAPTDQATLVVVAPTSARYGDTHTVTTTGGSGDGAVTYDASGPACTLTGDQLRFVAGSGDCSVTATKAASPGRRSTTSAPRTVAVSPRPVTGRFTAADKTFDGTPDATVTSRDLDGALPGDTVTLTGGTAAFDSATTGTGKTVTLTGATLTGTDAGNYTLSTVTTTTATIGAKTVTGRFTAADKTFDGTTDATVTSRDLDGALPGDTVTLTGGTAAFDSATTGTGKTVTLTGATLTGTDAGNYTLSTVTTTTATIGAKTVTGRFTAADKTFDGTTDATVTSRDLDGALPGDTVTLTGGTAAFDSATTGTGKTVTLTGATLTGTDAGNYTLSTVTTTTATIGAKTVTGRFTAADKTFDGTPDATVTSRDLDGALPGDTVTLTGGTAAFDSATTGTGKTVTLTGATLTGTDAGNYTLSTVTTTTATIGAKTVTGRFTAADKTFDGTTDATVTSRDLDGALPGDTVTLTGGTAAFDSATTGTGKTVTLTGATLTGTDAGNYTLSTVTTTTATISRPAVPPRTGSDDPTAPPTTTTTPPTASSTTPPDADPSGGDPAGATPVATRPAGDGATSRPTPTSTTVSAPGIAALALTVPAGPVLPGQRVPVVVRGEPGTAVELRAYSRPDTTYRVVRRGTVDEAGALTWDITPGTNTRVFAVAVGEPASASTSAVVLVRSELSLSVERTGTKRFVFSGRTLPRRSGELVTLYRVTSQGDVMAAQAVSGAGGLYRIERRFTGAGRTTFLARTGTTMTNTSGVSNGGRPRPVLVR